MLATRGRASCGKLKQSQGTTPTGATRIEVTTSGRKPLATVTEDPPDTRQEKISQDVPLEPCEAKVSRTVLTGGKLERAYLSELLFKCLTHASRTLSTGYVNIVWSRSGEQVST